MAMTPPDVSSRPRVWKRRWRWSVWPLLCIGISLLVATPTLAVLASVLEGADEQWAHLAATRLPRYLSNTAILAVSVCVIATAIGTSAAWLITTCQFPGRRVLRWALLLPLAVPGYLAAYAYTDLLQVSGSVQRWLRTSFRLDSGDYWFPEVRSLPGAIVILSMTLYPYVYLAARSAFMDHGSYVMEVGRTLGRGPWRSFFSLAIPLARPAIAAGGALVLMETLADFGAVEYCAVDTFATGVYHTWRSLESPTTAAQLSALLLSFVAIVVGIEAIARWRARFHQLAGPTRPVRRARLGPLASTGALALCGLPVLVGFVGPAAIFARMALARGDARAREVAIQFGGNTLTVAAVASLIAVTLAVLIAFGRRRSHDPITRMASRLAASGYALPGTVLAVGLLAPLSWLDHRLNDLTLALFDWQPGLILTGSTAAIIIGYQTRFLGVALGMIQAGFKQISPTMDDAARSLGASGTKLLWRVHLPLLRTSLLAAALLVFVDVAKELPATLMLRPFNFDTLAVRVYQLANDERLAEASFGALMIIAVALLPVMVLSIMIDRGQSKRPTPPPPAPPLV